jgi:hypothetical protein
MNNSEGMSNAGAAMALQGRKPGRRVRRYPMLKTNLSGEGALEICGPGGRRKRLKTLNSAKEIQGLPSLEFGRALLDSVRALRDLDLAWKKLEWR